MSFLHSSRLAQWGSDSSSETVSPLDINHRACLLTTALRHQISEPGEQHWYDLHTHVDFRRPVFLIPKSAEPVPCDSQEVSLIQEGLAAYFDFEDAGMAAQSARKLRPTPFEIRRGRALYVVAQLQRYQCINNCNWY